MGSDAKCCMRIRREKSRRPMVTIIGSATSARAGPRGSQLRRLRTKSHWILLAKGGAAIRRASTGMLEQPPQNNRVGPKARASKCSRMRRQQLECTTSSIDQNAGCCSIQWPIQLEQSPRLLGMSVTSVSSELRLWAAASEGCVAIWFDLAFGYYAN